MHKLHANSRLSPSYTPRYVYSGPFSYSRNMSYSSTLTRKWKTDAVIINSSCHVLCYRSSKTVSVLKVMAEHLSPLSYRLVGLACRDFFGFKIHINTLLKQRYWSEVFPTRELGLNRKHAGAMGELSLYGILVPTQSFSTGPTATEGQSLDY